MGYGRYNKQYDLTPRYLFLSHPERPVVESRVRPDMAAAEGALQQRRAAAMEKARQLIIERALEAELLAEDVEEPIRTFFVPSVTDIATGQPLPSQPSEVEPARSFG